METNTPQGWIEVDLSEIVEYRKGKKPKKMQPTYFDGALVYLDIKAIEKGADEIFVDRESSHLTSEKDLIVVWDGARAGWVGKSRAGAIGSTIMALTPKIDRDFLYRFLQTQFSYIQSNHRGTGIPHVDPDIFWNIKVPLPPLAEQRRIVAKLDAVMAKVEANKRRLDKIPRLLKRFRQSVLAAAVSGKLTEEWRERNGVVEEWKSMKAVDACETVASGSTPKNKPFFEKEEIPYLKVYNIVNQKIDFFYKPQYIKRAIHEKELKRCRIYPNDVVINIVGPPLGKVAIIPDTFPEWNINQAIVVFRPKAFLLPMFLYHILCDGKQIKDIELELRGTAGQSNISLTQCRDFDFPVPKLEEQHEIVARVEQLFGFADKLEARYTKAKALLDKLPQSILAKAFRGELVEQDPDDEPAGKLLELLEAEKIQVLKPKNGSKQNARRTKGSNL
jgi:type I restriction enzyme S subunit